jgi:ferric-dicitrate binding protein FerR (iron transport regulator)
MSEPREVGLPQPVIDDLPDRRERHAVEALWARLDSARPAPSVSTEERAAMWAAIASATEGARRAPPPPRPIVSPAWARRRRPVRAVVGLAAAALVTAVGLAGRPGPWQEIRVPRGAPQTVRLPDGSQVAVEAGGVLRFRREFRGWFGRTGRRDVELDGSAFFSVRRDGRPFAVHTYNAVVQVLGTAFSVQAREVESTGTSVAVAEGRVAVRGAANAEATLDAGQRTVVAHGAVAPGAVNAVPVERVAAWRTGGFVAVDEPLAAIAGALARRFAVDIVLDASVDGERRATLYLPDATLDRVLLDLAMVQGLVVERRRDGYVLRRP